MNITISNLVPVTAQPKVGQRVIQIAPGKWIPVGLGGKEPSGEGGSSPFDLVKVTNYTPTPSFNLTVQKVTGFSDSGLVRTYTTTGTDLSLTSADVLPVVNRLGIANDTKLLLLTNQTSSQLLLPSGFIWGYNNGQVLEPDITATNHDVIADAYGYFTLGNGKYFDFDSYVLTRSSPRTFIFQATLLGNQMQFVDGGSQDGGAMFGLGWGYSSGKIFYHFWGPDNGSWLDLATGSYVIAFVYDGQALTAYKDGEVLGSQTITLNTSSIYKYRIGQYTCDDWYSTGEWKSNFCAVFNRALTAAEVAAISAAVAPAS